MLIRCAPVILIILVTACSPQREQATHAENQSLDHLDSSATTKCADFQPQKKALFGDLHVHTSLSFDAYAYGVQTTPEDAYRFAKGEKIAFLPLAQNGEMSSVIQIDRPLDFVAVTDHAEFLGEQQLCTDKASKSFATEYCKTFRGGGLRAMISTATALATDPSERISPICAQHDPACLAASSIPWQTIIHAADNANDDCNFSAFVGYEYSGAPASSNYHRNVIFRSSMVPATPVSIFEAPSDYDLWQALDNTCKTNAGCDYLTIPHNSNLSNGRLLTPYAKLAANDDNKRAYAQQRLKREPLMEVFQHKGNSECANDFPDILGAADELCDVEQIRLIGKQGATGRVHVDKGKVSYTPEQPNPTEYCATGAVGYGGMQGNGCLSSNDFYRSALLTGLQEQESIGLNPVKLGASASTDSHMSTPGAVKESTWRGHIHTEWNKDGRLLSPVLIPSGKQGNPGGLTGVWAEENSRESIFKSLLRKEVFGTSGPRIKPRLFAGWDFANDICSDKQLAATAYTQGVPMGGDLTRANSSDAKPKFILTALADPAADATALQKLQLIKGWIDSTGSKHYQVFDVAGDANPTAGVDLQTGKRFGNGYSRLCGVFTDEAFNPAEAAYYYMRAVENPSPRWSLLDCISYSAAQRPSVCDDPSISTTIQEQAWTSPIWYSPRSN